MTDTLTTTASESTAQTLSRIGGLVRDARMHKKLTQAELAEALQTSQSAIARIEQGKQNVSLEMLTRISEALDTDVVGLPDPNRPINLRINGGRQLSGTIDVRSSKNAGVACLCAALLNKGKTTLRSLARIEEVNRITEVLNSIGVKTRWLPDSSDLEITPPARLELEAMDEAAARRTRTILMFLGPLLHEFDEFKLPMQGGCDLGERTVEPHLHALRSFGLDVVPRDGHYNAKVDRSVHPTRPIILIERGDTVTENALFAAARYPGTTIIRNASPNYMVQDLCYFLGELGVQVEGIGTTTLTVRGVEEIDVDIEYSPSEDPIEAMSLLTAAIVTDSQITIRRVPIEFMEIELTILADMGLKYETSDEYTSANGATRLVDLTTIPSTLTAPKDKIHPMPFPGVNIDNLPFFAVIAAMANGETLIHDWVYENRAIYLTELGTLGANVRLMDPHKILINGPTPKWRSAEIMCPPALRPGVVILLAMLAAPGESVLRNIYVINRGYEELFSRLNEIGADIQAFRD
ncbi:UDP-N-acetylglucosamine 1-carboxyvinyltransferase [Branchiibius sp. NY16-3462-2]|uniref:helix-turn-helix domain-containing protein n=1 Tax=Branchiibius sp. NY16-3462-2 TaxID=1807500 RepID=UPI0007975D52|nr:UDP-N-acetylglucosamine 1-carboxyvinyltransferase [Branchiibius sp. NY16-3462-2]KYH44096.1 UDP-N-acetylglucosamine 1-carboxyvinyltransferase [Branchiibius sp. NY16-3462-2]